MALDKSKLAKDFFNAFAKNTELTKEAKAELEAKCDAMASAVDAFVKSADILIDVFPGIPVATAGSPAAQTGATTAVGQGASKEIF